jgi:hypothetical protein
MPRLARLVVPGGPHHVTQRCNGREDFMALAMSAGGGIPDRGRAPWKIRRVATPA